MNIVKRNIAVVTSGYFPVPPVLGGAIETLIDLIIRENEKEKKIDITVFSCFNENAKAISDEYEATTVEYIVTPQIIQLLDKTIYFFVKNIFRIKKHMSFRYILQRLYFIKQVRKLLEAGDYDRVLLENNPVLLSTVKTKINHIKYKNKYYYHAHNIIYNEFGNGDTLRKCKAIISVSEFISNQIKNNLGTKSGIEYRVLRNRIDEERFRNVDLQKAKALREKYGIDKDEVVVMFTGRLNAEKGVNELLKAFENADVKNSRLVICGSYYFGSSMKSEYEEELSEAAKKLGNRVIFTGFIDYAEIPSYYAMADIMAAPSLWDEPALLAGIEAVTVGKPLITTNAGGIPEYAKSEYAYVIDKNSDVVVELTKALKLLINDSGLRKDYADKAIKVSEQWTKNSYYIDFLKCMDVERL